MHEKVDVVIPLRSMSRSASEARVVGSVRFVLHLSPPLLDQPSTKDTPAPAALREAFTPNVYVNDVIWAARPAPPPPPLRPRY
ncbi:hypothetical protein EVAR_96122_1 [Eumeta japonica]|uniref:Uncharacterized protein n=1 Tax=Eumeta variegata TaxID=151549 RepID=A0A4C1VGN1_EUMVA|nr:hypothetical protein EVAR_96122_1 [Eumeta japonica]